MEIEEIRNKLKEVIDPELGYDIVSLGEVEEIKILDKNKAYIKILPTTPMCPYLPFIVEMVNEKVEEIGLKAEIEIDFESKWSLEKIDPEIRKKLGI